MALQPTLCSQQILSSLQTKGFKLSPENQKFVEALAQGILDHIIANAQVQVQVAVTTPTGAGNGTGVGTIS